MKTTPPIYLILIIYFVTTRINQTKIRYTVVLFKNTFHQRTVYNTIILLLYKFCRRATQGCILEVKCCLSLQSKNTWYEWLMVCCSIITIHRHTSVNLISDCTCSVFCSHCLIIDHLNKQKMSVAERKKYFTSGKNNVH